MESNSPRIAKMVIILSLFFLLGFSCLTAGKGLSAPSAEIIFASYNAQKNYHSKEGRNILDAIRKLESENHPIISLKGALEEEQNSRGYCFASVGCWGGGAPHAERQVKVRNQLMHVVENGFQLPNDDVYPIHFVLAAGDNVYPMGVERPDSFDFYSVFESFYRYGRTNTSEENAETPRRSDLIPWMIALGNHDAIKNDMAQVDYTYKSIDENSDFAERWKEEMETRNVTGEFVSSGPTGRWFMPSNYYAFQVSNDTVLIVLDAPQLHRCAVHTSRLKKQVPSDRREQSINASSYDCIRAHEQQRDVEKWLTEEYAAIPYKIVMSHYPIVSNGPHENYPFMVKWLKPLLESSCAILYVNADNHYLQVSSTDNSMLYFANSGGGAGNNGKLHFPDKSPAWKHPQSRFQMIKGGFMVHCNLFSSRGSKRRFLNFVIAEDGGIEYTFENAMDRVQTCLQRNSSYYIASKRRIFFSLRNALTFIFLVAGALSLSGRDLVFLNTLHRLSLHFSVKFFDGKVSFATPLTKKRTIGSPSGRDFFPVISSPNVITESLFSRGDMTRNALIIRRYIGAFLFCLGMVMFFF